VYRDGAIVARDESLGRDVVVKIIAPESTGGMSAERFAREVKLAAPLQQANIVPAHSARRARVTPMTASAKPLDTTRAGRRLKTLISL
jgi:hypothetical protein